MAQKVEILMLDDLEPEKTADETVAFAYDGQSYEIDLTKQHAEKLRRELRPYVDVARKMAAPRAAKARSRANVVPITKTRGRSNGVDTNAIRAWAKERGYEVKDRGRVPANIVAEYQAAH